MRGKISWGNAGITLVIAVVSVALTYWFTNQRPKLEYEPVQSTYALTLDDQEYYVTAFQISNKGRTPLTSILVSARFEGDIVEHTDFRQGQMSGSVGTDGFTVIFDLPIRDSASWQVTSIGPVVRESMEVRCREVLGVERAVDGFQVVLLILGIVVGIAFMFVFMPLMMRASEGLVYGLPALTQLLLVGYRLSDQLWKKLLRTKDSPE